MYLVIDVGGTYMKYGYYHKDGDCFQRGKLKTIQTDLTSFYQSIMNLVLDSVEGIALSMPGMIDNQEGYIHDITQLPYLKQCHVKKDLETLTHLPVSLENDAKCATLGEMWKGSLQNVQNGMMIVFGSGIGGTIILNGQIYTSPHHKAGEVGSLLMPLDYDYLSMTNFGKNNNANCLIQDISQQVGCENDGITVFQVIQNNPIAFNIFQRYCRQIAFMIYNLDYLLDLQIVTIGGGISEQPLLITTIQNEYQKLREVYQEDTHQPSISACQFANEANLLGALKHYLNTYQKT